MPAYRAGEPLSEQWFAPGYDPADAVTQKSRRSDLKQSTAADGENSKVDGPRHSDFYNKIISFHYIWSKARPRRRTRSADFENMGIRPPSR
jgi:hypothetical protein